MIVYVLIVKHANGFLIDSVYKNLSAAQSQMAEMWKAQMIECFGKDFSEYAEAISSDLYVRKNGYHNYLDTTSGYVEKTKGSPNGWRFVINSYKVK